MVMGENKTPVQVTPSHTNTRQQNLDLVRTQLVEAGMIREADQFLTEYASMQAASRRRELTEHPITEAARKVGVDVHWVR